MTSFQALSVTAKRRGSSPRRLQRFFERSCDADPSAVAVECEGRRLTYAELDGRANQLAHHLLAAGLGPAARVGILLHRSVETYVALLAVLKAGGTFVPIDPASPAERVAFIAEDAELAVMLSHSGLAGITDELDCGVVELDTEAGDVAFRSVRRPDLADAGDPDCYVIYTSGSTGRPKGVQVAQSSICNFIDVVPSVYDVQPGDRVYQGMTISFDFSIEEIWPTWAVGATVVAGPTDDRRLGDGLATFLTDHQVSVLYCVPTVLATLEVDLPTVRSLIVGGEACPAELVWRWSRPERRMLNTYGPTEATVTATWSELVPGRGVTIGAPLPSYRIEILDEELRRVAPGEVGEICIGGVGVARGYIGLPERTAERFVADPFRAGQRLYRTGDLGQLTDDGEIAYLGRADSEVKIRGHRVDLGEIESVLLADRSVGGAVVAVTSSGAVGGDLAAYLTRRSGVDEDAEGLVTRLHRMLTDRLPPYMVPSFMELLPTLPMLASGKADRGALPAPSGHRLISSDEPRVAADTPTEQQLVQVWAHMLELDEAQVSVEADFFLDLGGHSLLAATVVSRLRQDGMAEVSVADIYAHPTVRGLAAHLDTRVTSVQAIPDSDRPQPVRHRSRRVVGAGSSQLGLGLLLLLAFGTPFAVVLGLSDGALSARTLWLLAATVPIGWLIGRLLLPIGAARWLAAGIRPGRYPLWGATFLRLWFVEKLLALAPAAVLAGSPLLPPYLRLLGAKIGRDCHIATAGLPLPALLEIGDNASIGYGAQLHSSFVEDGWLVVKPVVIGDRAFVGSQAVLRPGARLGAGASLDDQSLAAEDQVIPAGEHWAGSPSAPRSTPRPLLAAMAARPAARRWPRRLIAGFVVGWLGLDLLPFLLAAPAVLLAAWSLVTGGALAGLLAVALAGPVYVVSVCLLLAAGKRIVLASTPTGIHPLRSALGLRKWLSDKLLEASLASTNSLYATLYTVPWLRALGARIGRRCEVSTAAHLDPDLLTLEGESFVADMAAVGTATYHNGQVALGRTHVGTRSFVGNAALLPAGVRLEGGSLIGVQSVPPAGGAPEGTSWLGSPPFRLLRRQDSGDFSECETFRPSRSRVAERLVIEFFRVVLPATLLGLAAYGGLLALAAVAARSGVLGTLLALPVVALLAGLTVATTVAALKWLIIGRYRSRVEPLWSRFVRRTELVTGLYEASAVPALLGGLTGTPLLGPALRLFGARVGRRTYLATTHLTEFDLVRIGDDVAIGAGTSLQTHLFEDRVMKMSTVTIEPRATVAARSVVLYDTTVGEGAVLDALSLVMKGERLMPHTRWRGIPGRSVA